jgi:hypothetical protein
MKVSLKVTCLVAVIFLCLYSTSCGSMAPKAQAQGQTYDGKVECDRGCNVSVDSHTVTMITESFHGATKAATFDFPLKRPVVIDSVSGTVSYKGMSGACSGQEIAVVGFISGTNSATGEGQNLVAYDLYTYGNTPVNIAVNQNFPEGIPIDALHESVYDDLCHVTDFRTALVFHIKQQP